MNRFILSSWIIAAGLLFLYSYTQVSLSLALNRSPFLFSIQQAFQYIGYFNRPLSTGLFISLICLMTVLYAVTLHQIFIKKITVRSLTYIIGAVSIILIFSYNAFSFDIFNYIFDAKIFTFYQDNPYVHKALDYPGDPMLSFMQWTHRTYPYGPVWLAITIPLSYLGMQYFLLTFFIFKLLSAAAYIGTCYFIYKIMKIHKKDHAVFMTALFGLNPLVLTEFLVSAHNDSVMLFLAAVSLFVLVQNKRILSGLLLLLSIGIKFATGFLLPMYAIIALDKKYWNYAVLVGVVSTIAAVIAASQKSGNFQPWYLTYILFVLAFMSPRPIVIIPVIIMSVTGLLQYAPFLYFGNWDPPVPQMLDTMLAVGLVLSALCTGIYMFMQRLWKV